MYLWMCCSLICLGPPMSRTQWRNVFSSLSNVLHTSAAQQRLRTNTMTVYSFMSPSPVCRHFLSFLLIICFVLHLGIPLDVHALFLANISFFEQIWCLESQYWCSVDKKCKALPYIRRKWLPLSPSVRKLFPTLHHTVAAVIKIMPWPGRKAYYPLLCISEIHNKGEEKGSEAKSHFLKGCRTTCFFCVFVIQVGSQINWVNPIEQKWAPGSVRNQDYSKEI